MSTQKKQPYIMQSLLTLSSSTVNSMPRCALHKLNKLIPIIIILLFTWQPAYSHEKLGAPVDFPNVPEIPVPKGVGYNDFFKNGQTVKIVFGVSDPNGQLNESLVNAAYSIKYLKPRGIKYEIEIVLYGKAVRSIDSFNEEYAGHSELMAELNSQGVVFAVCNNTLSSINLDKEDLYPYAKIVPAGILELTKKQMQGFSYIHNTL
ncbi:MAG: DsrE family protein [Ghiorsea sp.]|nr:DsrE family protein [Ghiorsea sp.]